MSEAGGRQVALDLETTGLAEGNWVIEVGCVEVVARQLTGRELQRYVNPGCPIEAGAQRIHGITDAQLRGEPKFAEVAEEVLAFVRDAEVLIHNAPFDLGFLDRELERAGYPRPFRDYCGEVTDTLDLAKEKNPGGTSLDHLCDIFGVDRSERKMHGALVDARLLAQVYLRMTGGQLGMALAAGRRARRAGSGGEAAVAVPEATEEELREHEALLDLVEQQCEEGRACVWRA